MDQIVRKPAGGAPQSVESVLGLSGDGSKPRRRSGPMRLAIAAFVLLAVAVGGYLAFGGQGGQTIRYATTSATKGDITVEVSATGTLSPLTQVDISSELSGVVSAVHAGENQRVKQGDVLAELDTTRLEAQIEGAEASAAAARARVADARTTLSEAEAALVRTRQLAERGMATDQALEAATAVRDRADSAVDIAEANLAIAAADLKLKQADLAKSRIVAPIDGIVLTRSVNPGQTVASSMQAPVLFVIAAELERMELKAAIDEADIGTVEPGQTARFTVDAFPDRRFDAAIRDIAFAAVTTEGVVTYNARLDVDNGQLLLRPGMTATVAIVTREAKGVIVVPTAAFRFRPPATAQRGGWSLQNLFMPRFGSRTGQRRPAAAPEGQRMLYVLRNGAAEPVPVTIGATDGEMTEIVSGLAEGDQVITGAVQGGG